MFAKLYVPDVVDDVLIRRLKLYLDTVKTVRSPISCPFVDISTSNN